MGRRAYKIRKHKLLVIHIIITYGEMLHHGIEGIVFLPKFSHSRKIIRKSVIIIDSRRIYSMKLLLVISLILVVLSGCPMGMGRVYDSFQGQDRTLPRILSYGLADNASFTIVYDKVVYISDAELDREKLSYNAEGTIFTIPLGIMLGRGERRILSVTAEDMIGNTLRSSFILVGRNPDIPAAVINEASIQGTGDAPDRIELLFLSEGNTAGLALSDGGREMSNHTFTFPDIEVRTGDMAVIYWNSEHTGPDTINENGYTAYILDGGSDKTLSGTNGAIILYKEEGGEIMDGIVYTNGENPDADGYGNNITREAALILIEEGEWGGEPVDSSLVTSSRVLARIPGGWDTNTCDDFFTTEPRKSTFGYHNQYFPYE